MASVGKPLHHCVYITLIHVDTVYPMGTLDSNLCLGSHADSENVDKVYIYLMSAHCVSKVGKCGEAHR
jgi:hypothetical protein